MFKYPLTRCDDCTLSCKFGQGYQGDPDNADIVLLGEAPGSEEERTGLPFQGRSGQLLRTVLKDKNFPVNRLIMSNPVLCRPHDNKTPDKIYNDFRLLF